MPELNFFTVLPFLCDFRILHTKYYMAFQNELLEFLNVAFVLFLSAHVFLVTCSTRPFLDRNPGGSTYFDLCAPPFLLFQAPLIFRTTSSKTNIFQIKMLLYLKTFNCCIFSLALMGRFYLILRYFDKYFL